MNAGTPKGRAYGFKLNVLNQLKSTKSIDNKRSLIQFIVSVLPEKVTHDLISRDFVEIAKVAKTESGSVSSEVGKIRQTLGKLEKAIETCKHMTEEQLDGDLFLDKMEAFYESAQARFVGLNGKLEAAVATCDALCVHFGEDSGKLKWEELFEKFHSFAVTYQEAHRVVEKELGDTKRRNSQTK